MPTDDDPTVPDPEPILGPPNDTPTDTSFTGDRFATGSPLTPRGLLPVVPGYTVTGIVGEGGMGAVYEAQQHKPARRGALKFILPGAVTPRSIRRFEHEHEVLARLQHPGIAAIYAAGLHDGTPSLATTGACWGRPGQKNVTVQFVHVINFDACRLGGVAGYPN